MSAVDRDGHAVGPQLGPAQAQVVDAAAWRARAEALAAASNMWRAHAEALAGAAQKALDGCVGASQAADELMTEFVSKQRAAKWDLINDGLVSATRGIAAVRAALASLPAQALAERRALEACASASTPLAWDDRWGIWLAQMPFKVARVLVSWRAKLQEALAALDAARRQ